MTTYLVQQRRVAQALWLAAVVVFWVEHEKLLVT